MTALLGHNGAGKTTTFSMISGVEQPTSGSIRSVSRKRLKTASRNSESLNSFEDDAFEDYSASWRTSHDLHITESFPQNRLGARRARRLWLLHADESALSESYCKRLNESGSRLENLVQVYDHCRFYAMLAGVSRADFEVRWITVDPGYGKIWQLNFRKLISQLGMDEEANMKAKKLSGGQKRKLCVMNAIIGEDFSH